ncbi:MAG: hypothetical protein PF489_12060 [Salinivirgaceae bacterium]|jgi:hypothetical protein|nr:hypothetical protein [Salinivirgaceae bacterium]
MKKYNFIIIEEPEVITDDEMFYITGGKNNNSGSCYCFVNSLSNKGCEEENRKLFLFKRIKNEGICLFFNGCKEKSDE